MGNFENSLKRRLAWGFSKRPNKEGAVPNATVNGSWSAGANGSGSCVTNGSGQCSITKNNINKNSSSVTFTVDSVSHASLTYAPGNNHDTDSNGRVIVVAKP